MDPKTLKRGLNYETIFDFRHIGRLWSQNSDLSDGQAWAIREKFGA